MSDEPGAVLSTYFAKGLADRIYEKRKAAGLELRRHMKMFMDEGKWQSIVGILKLLKDEYVFGLNTSARKGGLLALSAIAILPECKSVPHIKLEDFVTPPLICMLDPDCAVRWSACEALYNIAKFTREEILQFFPEMFDNLCKLAHDPDKDVQEAAQVLDRLLKDVVTERDAPNIDIEQFVRLLAERIHTQDPGVRQFLVSWITVLDSVPGVDLVKPLPSYLRGLFCILSEDIAEIRDSCQDILKEFFGAIKSPKDTDLVALVRILVPFCSNTTVSELLQSFMAISWISKFIEIGKSILLPYVPDICGAILPWLSGSVDTKLRELAVSTNQVLIRLIASTDKDLLVSEQGEDDDCDHELIESSQQASTQSPMYTALSEQSCFSLCRMLHLLTTHLDSSAVETRVCVIRWCLLLHSMVPTHMGIHADELVESLLNSLLDESDKVVKLSLEALSELSTCEEDNPTKERKALVDGLFQRFISGLLSLFNKKAGFLANRGDFIIRHLASLIPPKRMYTAMASTITNQPVDRLSQSLVQTLNRILLTARELEGIREELKCIDNTDKRLIYIVVQVLVCEPDFNIFAVFASKVLCAGL
eukprot:m.307302 g.307302  ORF g.307302 m.307302 type:complete len:592 (-) comp16458_c1_seq2:801-2576(-)